MLYAVVLALRKGIIWIEWVRLAFFSPRGEKVAAAG
jgi:hypothetical protein